jgi:hypothetical protein
VKVVQGRALHYCFYSLHVRLSGLVAATLTPSRNHARGNLKPDWKVLVGWVFQTFDF